MGQKVGSAMGEGDRPSIVAKGYFWKTVGGHLVVGHDKCL